MHWKTPLPFKAFLADMVPFPEGEAGAEEGWEERQLGKKNFWF